MKYSEFLQRLIDTEIPAYIEYLDNTAGTAYLCNVLAWAEGQKRLTKSDKNAARLRKTIKEKLARLCKKINQNALTISRAVGWDTAARICWLRTLIAIHQKRGN